MVLLWTRYASPNNGGLGLSSTATYVFLENVHMLKLNLKPNRDPGFLVGKNENNYGLVD